MSVPFTPLVINGHPRPSTSGTTFDVHNPFSGTLVGTAASADSADCRAAIDAAAEAFKTWERTPIGVKRDIFLRAADIVLGEKYQTRIMQAMREETCAPMFWGPLNWGAASLGLRTMAGMVGSMEGETFESQVVPGGKVFVERRAMGVMLAIAPWNAPFHLSLRAIALPILCGNTVVLKSSECSPRSQALVLDLLEEAGLPAGVANFISMSRETAPALTAEIIAHPLVRHINFTGSDRVGRILAMEAAKHLKPCVFELGGKAPVIVLNDANIPEAARAIAFGAMAHAGQVCMSTERIIAQRPIADALIAAVKELCASLKAGDINEPDIELGALFTEASAENVLGMLKEAKEAGAEVLLGDLQRVGAVVQPHLVRGVKPGMRLWEKESFGPVAVFAVVDSVDEAVELANASEYSLTSSVWSSDVYAAMGIASRIHAGWININGMSIHSESSVGLGGLGGASGYGRFDIEHFTVKHVTVVHPLGRKYPFCN